MSPTSYLAALPRDQTSGGSWWRGEDSNLRRRQPTDLQSAPFGRFGTPPAPSWSWRTDSNRRPPAYKAGALPVELRQRLRHADVTTERDPAQAFAETNPGGLGPPGRQGTAGKTHRPAATQRRNRNPGFPAAAPPGGIRDRLGGGSARQGARAPAPERGSSHLRAGCGRGRRGHASASWSLGRTPVPRRALARGHRPAAGAQPPLATAGGAGRTNQLLYGQRPEGAARYGWEARHTPRPSDPASRRRCPPGCTASLGKG